MQGRDKKKRGFTLLELMVVIGIIATLMGVLISSFAGAGESAEKAKVQDLVLSVKAAMETVLNRNMAWPQAVISNNNKQLDEDTAMVFVAEGLLGLATNKDKNKLMGQDRCGVVDHWAAAALKRSASTSGGGDKSLKVGSGARGTVEDHTLWYAVDTDGNGFTEISAKGIGSLKVRATVCVWAAGKDGEVADWKDAGRSDDVYSWTIDQVAQ